MPLQGGIRSAPIARMPDEIAWKAYTVTAIELGGVAMILIGGIAATVRFLLAAFAVAFEHAYQGYRRDLGRAILLGLEFLVAADIINTVAVDPSLESVAVLAGIVLIRTFLSFSLEVEIEGQWPWQRGRALTGTRS